MKKALALVLALVLALSMAVSAFAVTWVDLTEDKPEAAELKEIEVIAIEDADDYVLYTNFAGMDWETLNPTYGTEYYVALDPTVEYKDVEVTANGNITAELVKFDPDTMEVTGTALVLTYDVLVKGEEGVELNNGVFGYADVEDKYEAAYAKTGSKLPARNGGSIPVSNLTYDEACAVVSFLKGYKQSGRFSVECNQEVNIIKITVADNFTAHYTEGTLKVKAVKVADKKTYVGEIDVINDVTIFEYEQVKYAAANNAKGAYLQLGEGGYSDYWTTELGYSLGFDEYDEDVLRLYPAALVVSTTAFRAIAGEDLTVVAAVPATFEGINDRLDALLEDIDFELSVTLKDIEAGQKGINFFAWAGVEGVEINEDTFDRYPSAITFGFKGDQVVKGEFEITVDLPINWYELRELFGLKVEEDDIISYYIVDEAGKVVGGKEIDYMTADITENVEFTVTGKNQKLGEYTLCLEVPAAEEGEANPNTGAESVVGVVAALAVVSVATAAAVSLKK